MSTEKTVVRSEKAGVVSKDAPGDTRVRHLPAKTVSLKRVEANRRNAALSTGPKSPEGKARVARNALKHGVLSRETVLPREDPATFQELADALWAAWQPLGAQEEVLVEQVVQLAWRLRRLGKAEAEIFTLARGPKVRKEEFSTRQPSLLGHAFLGPSEDVVALGTLSRYESGIERGYYRALHELQRLQQARRAGQGQPPGAADEGGR